MRVLISACLLGVSCRYDGASKPHSLAAALARCHELVPVCPEQLGGLATPRPPAERQGNRVVTRSGTEVPEAFCRGAAGTLRLCKALNCQAAVLKERSPSCGHGQIYDGTFTATLSKGDGVTAELLGSHGIRVYGESQLEELLK